MHVRESVEFKISFKGSLITFKSSFVEHNKVLRALPKSWENDISCSRDVLEERKEVLVSRALPGVAEEEKTPLHDALSDDVYQAVFKERAELKLQEI